MAILSRMAMVALLVSAAHASITSYHVPPLVAKAKGAGSLSERSATQKTNALGQHKTTGVMELEKTVMTLRGGGNLKIALCSWESLHTIAVGGVAPHVTELAAALQRRGHEVHVFTRAPKGEQSGAHTYVDGVNLHKVNFDLDPDLVNECNNMCNAFTWYLRETETHMMYNFDIVHCHDWLAAKALVQLKQAGRKCVLTMHSTEFGRSGNKHAEGGMSARIRGIEQEGCDYADRVICVSGKLCDEVKMYNCHDKLRMAYNAVQIHHFEGIIDSAEFKGRYGIMPLQPTVLFVGRLSTQKGPDILLDAVPGILQTRGDAVVVFVGEGDMKSELERKAQEMGIGHAVRFVGKQSGQTLINWFKVCDTAVVPSRNEPFGIVVLEAWACAKPVVVTKCGGPGEFVRHEDDGWHVDPEAGSIAWGVSQVFNDWERSKHMGLRGRERCFQEFTWDNIADQTERIYYEVLDNGGW